MADGDLFLTLLAADDEHVPGPADPVPPPLGSCGSELYAACFPLAREDHLHGWALAHLCEALGRMRQAVSDIVRETDQGPGWSPLTDVDRAPGADSEIDLLPALAQMVGVRLVPELNDTERRDAIREREGFWRGTTRAVIAAAQRHLTGQRRVILRERFDPGNPGDQPYHVQLITFRQETPTSDLLLVRAAVEAALPAGLILHYDVVTATDFEQVRQDFETFDHIRTGFADFGELADYEGA